MIVINGSRTGASPRGITRENEAARLRDRVRGFQQYIETHRLRGNVDAVAEAEAELRRLLELIERRLAGRQLGASSTEVR